MEDLEKQIRSFIAATILVHTACVSYSLTESENLQNSKYAFDLTDVLKAADRATRAFSYIDRNKIKGIFNDTVKENLLSLIDAAIVKIGETIEFLHKVKTENQKEVLNKVSSLVDDLELLRETTR